MFGRYERSPPCRSSKRGARALIVIAISQVIFSNHVANGAPKTAWESQSYETVPSAIIEADARVERMTCDTPGCRRAASIILSNMDPNVDPCDNFYKYACGGFINSNVIPEDKSSIDSFSIIGDELQEQLRITLESKSQDDEPHVFSAAKNLYQSCINEAAIEDAGLQPLYKYLSEFGGWPVVVGDSWNGDGFDWKSTTYKLREAGYSFDYLIDVAVGVDMKNSSKRVLGLDQADLGLSREYLTKGFDDKIVSAYYSYMVDIAKMLGAENDSAEEELRESLIFEMRLANISIPSEERRDSTQLYNPMTLAELTEKYPSVSWKDYLENLLPPNTILEEDEVVIVYAPSYIANLVKLVEETEKRVLANYFMWRAAQESIDWLNNDMRERLLAYATVLSGQTKLLPRWKTCVNLLTRAFPTIVGSMYISQNFDKEAKEAAVEMVADIRRQFTETLENTAWMDDKTRQNAVEKAEAMYSHIAYPDELLDTDKLENIFGKLSISEDEYFDNIYKISRFTTDRRQSMLRKPVNKTDWETHGYAAIVNAFYSPLENSIQFPAGILQGVFFGSDRPKYLNYGGIGSVIGHEITHGFDDEGRQFDKSGNLVDWWTSTTKDNFLERAQCIIDQYGNYTVEEVGLELNGIKSQGENIADNGGIKGAYYAYEKLVERNGPEPGLPGIDKSPKQLFWLGAASVWCSTMRPDALRLKINIGVHVPSEFRVVGPLSNAKEFSRDFNCPEGSRMNPAKKCSVW